MKRFFAAAVSGLVIFAASCAPDQTVFKDPDGAFTVAYPGKVQPQLSTGTTQLNQLVTTDDTTIVIPERDYALTSASGVGMVVKVFDFTGHEMLAGEAIHNAIDSWKTGSSKFSVLDWKTDDREGPQVSYTLPNGTDTVFRVFYNGGKLYSLAIDWATGAKPAEITAAQRFLDSFHFAAAKTQADDWVTLNDPDGFFTALYPVASPFTSSSFTIPDLDNKDVPVKQYVAASRDDDVSTAVEVYEFRGKRDAGVELMNSTYDNLKKSAATVISDTTVDAAGQKWREVHYTTSDGTHSSSRFVAVGAGRIYVLTIAWRTSATKREVADAKQFFESFGFTSPQPDDWTVINDPNGVFTVAFPAKPYEHPDKKYGTMVYSFGTSSDDAPFSVGINNVNIPAQDAMSAMGYILKKQAAQVISDSSFELDNHTGREVELLSKDQTRVIVRYFAFDHKVYSVAIESLPEPSEQERADHKHFLDSFHFLR